MTFISIDARDAKRSRANACIRFLGALLVVALLASPGFAKDPKPEPEFMRKLYPPELVMKNHRAIDLTKDQRRKITEAIQATQAATLELGWSMQDASTRLTKEMGQTKIDADVAMEAASEVLAIEGKVKRSHLALLIEIKNALTAEQHRQLDAIRSESE